MTKFGLFFIEFAVTLIRNIYNELTILNPKTVRYKEVWLYSKNLEKKKKKKHPPSSTAVFQRYKKRDTQTVCSAQQVNHLFVIQVHHEVIFDFNDPSTLTKPTHIRQIVWFNFSDNSVVVNIKSELAPKVSFF